jgi:pimeloyl-ACP methyl ester carboxylesterase
VDVHVGGLPAARLDQLEFSCSTLAVPLDPAAPAREDIVLQLIRVHQSDGSEEKPPLLLIAGGPGQSGVQFASSSVALLPDALLDRFDLVGFDPRGVGSSQPIACVHSEQAPRTFPDLVSDDGFRRSADVIRAFADECAASLGPSASLFSTTATAVDIDRIRAALDQPTLTYIGWSYGAKLGAEYARLYPDKVRAAVLDAPTDPSTSWIETVEGQVAGFERAFGRFVTWCAERGQCSGLGDVTGFVRGLVDRAQQSPIPSGRPGDEVATNGMEVLDAVASAMYDDMRWPDLASGIAEASRGDSGTLRDLMDAARDPDDVHAGDAQFVINCNDSAPGPTEAAIKAAGRRLVEQFPLFGAWGSWQLFGCAYWTPDRHTLLPPAAATTDPVVVVGTRFDPATPYSGAESMASVLGNARLLTWEGNGHGAVGRSQCITDLVVEYLDALVLPPPASSTCRT